MQDKVTIEVDFVNKITTVKNIRQALDCGLLEAKNIADAVFFASEQARKTQSSILALQQLFPTMDSQKARTIVESVHSSRPLQIV